VQVSPVADKLPEPVDEVESANVFIANVAVTLFAASIVNEQTPVPVHDPDHPVNVLDMSGAAVNCTLLPEPNDADAVEQPFRHEIPEGDEVTFPVPDPAFVSETEYNICENVAATFFALVILTVQVFPLVESQPVNPENVYPAFAVAVITTLVP
jgi:hypothetical protein